MSAPRTNRQSIKPNKPFQIIVLGSLSQYPELTYFEQELKTFILNLRITFIQQSSKLTTSLLLNFTNDTIVFVLTRTAKDLASLAIKAVPNKSNLIFYLESSQKDSKCMKVMSRWEFYKFLAKKVELRTVEVSKKVQDNNRLMPICVRVFQSQNNQFNNLVSVLAVKYSQKQTLDFRIISNIKELLQGRYEKRILIVNNRQGDYAKHYLTQVMARDQKVYSILFEGSKVSEFNFNTSNIADIEHLLDSLLIKHSRNNNSSERIKMKSVKKVNDIRDAKSKVLVIESHNQRFCELFCTIQGAHVVRRLRNEHLTEKVNVVVNYNECAQALAHIASNQNLSVLVFAETLFPNQIYKHPSVKLLTDNPEDILKFVRLTSGNNRISTNISPQNLLLLAEQQAKLKARQSQKMNQLPIPIPRNPSITSLGSSKLLTKSRGTFPNGMKFMEWDTKLIKNSNGVFCTYPQDEPDIFQMYTNRAPSQPSLDYVTFETFGKLKSGKVRNNTHVTTSSMEPSQQQRQVPQSQVAKSSLSIIEQLAPVISITDIRQPLQPIQEKGQRSSYSSSDKKSNQFPNLPMQSQLFTQTKSSKIEFSESFDHLYSESNHSQMNSKMIHTKQRQSHIQAQSKILEDQPKQRFNSLNISGGVKLQRQSAELTSFLTQTCPSEPKIKEPSQKQLTTIQQQVYQDSLKESKSLQTEVEPYRKYPQYSIQRDLIEISIKPEPVSIISYRKQAFGENSSIFQQSSVSSEQKIDSENIFYHPESRNIQLIAKRNFNFIQPQLHPNTVFNLYEFYTSSQLKYIALRINPEIRTILIVDEVPEIINYFAQYSYFDCIVVPGTKLFQHQKMRYPHFKWVISENPQAISYSINKHILSIQSSHQSFSDQPLTVLYFYDQIELEQQLMLKFGRKIAYQKYHSPQSLLSHVTRSPLAVILNLPFEWISEQIRQKNPQAFLITYSNGSKVFERNGTIGLARKKQQVIDWVSRII